MIEVALAKLLDIPEQRARRADPEGLFLESEAGEILDAEVRSEASRPLPLEETECGNEFDGPAVSRLEKWPIQ